MRSKIIRCAFAIGMLIAMSVFAQAPGAKPDKAPSPASVAQVQGPQRVSVKEYVQKKKLVRMVNPIYPPALNKRLNGTVVLHVVVAKDGAVNSARYVSGPPNLKNSALNAVLQWRYNPTLVNGVPVEVETTVSVVFPRPEKVPPPVAWSNFR